MSLKIDPCRLTPEELEQLHRDEYRLERKYDCVVNGDWTLAEGEMELGYFNEMHELHQEAIAKHFGRGSQPISTERRGG